jgi:hypothetical protein
MTTLHTITSHVRGGGAVGSAAWVAKITGRDEKFGLARKFVRKQDHRSGSGRSGCLHFVIQEPGFYEYRGVGTDESSIASQRRTRAGGAEGFIRVTETGEVEDVTKDDVVAAFQHV